MSIITVAVVFISHYQQTGPYLDSKRRKVRYRKRIYRPTLSLNYSAFGPQRIARDLIGDEFWQWQAHGDPNTRYDIKVVVYKGVAEIELSERFPIIEEKYMDYRYLRYSDAMTYLNTHIAEGQTPEVTRVLVDTREKLAAYF